MSGEPLLDVTGVSKRFGGLKAVDGVSLKVGAGEIVSIIGPNGAGKTTFFNLLTGQLRPTEGQIRFKGQDITRLRPHHRARLGFGRTFQISQTMTSLSVLENAMIGGFLKLRGNHAAAVRAMAALDSVGLEAKADRKSSELTLGERRRLEVARAIAMEPDIILLDEVMAGLNETEITEILDLVHRLNEAGKTFLVIEHNLKVVRAFSRRVVVLDRGAMLAEGNAEEVLSNRAVIEAYLGASTA
ncbi:ABC transporter ATP-binding protein [Seohaeicola zhoushanensis]|uniref:ABC transporter ATP-binding protein n=1 Tax=Seohaeicola zhoushanensis TaxID=1569283 RepID=A0A8J3M9E8_9RHOB|nr:ABC transporter ATP-binding protein [Seohaeicola zhoushanensis]GHF67256.1 ABC transporter ATP-binding protein [Seohaeicola zhoushanensis]